LKENLVEVKNIIQVSKDTQFKELNEFIVDYFQEWLDLNSLQQFRSQVTPISRLNEDWLVFEGIYG